MDIHSSKPVIAWALRQQIPRSHNSEILIINLYFKLTLYSNKGFEWCCDQTLPSFGPHLKIWKYYTPVSSCCGITLLIHSQHTLTGWPKFAVNQIIETELLIKVFNPWWRNVSHDMNWIDDSYMSRNRSFFST